MSKIVGIDHVQLAMPPGQEDAARAFCGDVLGMTEHAKPANLAPRGGVWFTQDTVKIHLGVDAHFHPATKAHPALVVDNLESLSVQCAAAGYTVIEDELLVGFKRVYVTDPFDNRLELMEVVK